MLKRKKTIPLPCTEEQYKTIKVFCLLHGYKYSDITTILLNYIEGVENDKDTSNGNDV